MGWPATTGEFADPSSGSNSRSFGIMSRMSPSISVLVRPKRSVVCFSGVNPALKSLSTYCPCSLKIMSVP